MSTFLVTKQKITLFKCVNYLFQDNCTKSSTPFLQLIGFGRSAFLTANTSKPSLMSGLAMQLDELEAVTHVVR